MNKSYSNILIVRTDRIGDVVLTTPAVRALRKAYPVSRISMLVSAATRDLVNGNRYLDEVIVDDKCGKHKGLFGFLRLVNLIRRKKYGLAIIFHTKKRSNSLCFLAGIPERIGYKNNKFGFLLTHPIEDTRHHGKKHEAQYCLDVLRHLGILSKMPDDLRLCVPVTEESEKWLQRFLQRNNIKGNGRIIVIHPGASDPSKIWPGHFFAEFINNVVEQYAAKIVIIGSSGINEIARKISSMSNYPVINMAGKTTVSELVSLLKRSDLLVSNDSGPVHVAVAAGTPVISIFTRNQPGINPERWGPLSEKSRIASVPRDSKICFSRAGVADSKYLELIKPKQVLEAVDAIFKLC